MKTFAQQLTPSSNHFGGLQPGRSRWQSAQFDEWVPVRPSVACEIEFNRLDGMRFRHSVRLLRWRPDLDPADCSYQQLERFGAGPSNSGPGQASAGRRRVR